MIPIGSSMLNTTASGRSITSSVTHRGSELFELTCANDLEGIVAKRLVDPYDTRIRWLKIKNRAYTQNEGRSDLFNGPRHSTERRPRR